MAVSWKPSFVSFALVLCLAPAALAQQPFATDDADTTARGKFHFEFSNSYDLLQRSALPAARQNTASFEIAYGLFEGLEIGVEMPLITIFNVRDTTPRRITGIGDTNIGVKYNFRRERENSRLPAFTISGNIEIPTGSVARGLGSGIADYSLNGIAQKSLTSRTVLRGNLGVIFSGNTATGALGFNRARGTVLTGGTSIVRRFNERLYLGAEVTGAKADNLDLGADQLQFQVGGNFLLLENFSLDFGIAAGRKAADPRIGGQLGFAVDF